MSQDGCIYDNMDQYGSILMNIDKYWWILANLDYIWVPLSGIVKLFRIWSKAATREGCTGSVARKAGTVSLGIGINRLQLCGNTPRSSSAKWCWWNQVHGLGAWHSESTAWQSWPLEVFTPRSLLNVYELVFSSKEMNLTNLWGKFGF